MVVLANTGRAVVRTARVQAGGVERVDRGAIRDDEGDVRPGSAWIPRRDPELGLVVASEAGATELREVHDHSVAERPERPLEEGLAHLVVRDVQADVVDHSTLLLSLVSAR